MNQWFVCNPQKSISTNKGTFTVPWFTHIYFTSAKIPTIQYLEIHGCKSFFFGGGGGDDLHTAWRHVSIYFCLWNLSGGNFVLKDPLGLGDNFWTCQLLHGNETFWVLTFVFGVSLKVTLVPQGLLVWGGSFWKCWLLANIKMSVNVHICLWEPLWRLHKSF